MSLPQRVIRAPQRLRSFESRRTDIRLLSPSHLTVRALIEQHQSDKSQMDQRAIGLLAYQNAAKMLQRLASRGWGRFILQSRLLASWRWSSKTVAANLKACLSRHARYFEMPRLHILFLSAATLTLLNVSAVAQAQYCLSRIEKTQFLTDRNVTMSAGGRARRQ